MFSEFNLVFHSILKTISEKNNHIKGTGCFENSKKAFLFLIIENITIEGNQK